jgi:hypothetical protein
MKYERMFSKYVRLLEQDFKKLFSRERYCTAPCLLWVSELTITLATAAKTIT